MNARHAQGYLDSQAPLVCSSNRAFSRLEKDTSSPFSYGVRDLQSIDSSDEGLAAFKQHCAEQILRYEPRLEDIDIGSCVINKMTQSLEMEITSKIRGQRNELSTKIYID